MATTLYLRNTTGNQTNTGTAYSDMLPAAGAATVTKTATTTAAGTEIAFTGGQWVSGRFPAGGSTLTAITLNLYGLEAAAAANATLGVRFYKRTAAGVESELLSTGRVNDNAELGTAAGLMNWTYTPNQNATFAENDRLVVKVFVSNLGTMATGHVVTLNYNNGTGSPAGSNIVLTQTLTFKSEPPTPSDPVRVKHGGVWKTAISQQAKVAGVWREAEAYVRHAGVWKSLTGTVPFSPADLASLMAWFDGNEFTGQANGTGVPTWADQEGANDATTGGAQPTVAAAALNGMAAVEFNGVSNYLAPPNFMAGKAAGSAFFVAKIDDDPPIGGGANDGPVLGDWGNDGAGDSTLIRAMAEFTWALALRPGRPWEIRRPRWQLGTSATLIRRRVLGAIG